MTHADGTEKENPGFSTTDKPQQAILAMGTKGDLDLMAKLTCKDVPAYAADAPALARFARIGIEPCKPFALDKLDPAMQDALTERVADHPGGAASTARTTRSASRRSAGRPICGALRSTRSRRSMGRASS